MTATIISEKILYRGRLSAVAQEIEFDDGRRYVHETVRHPGAVVVVPLLDAGRLVLVKQYRHAIGSWIVEFPAGTLESGEIPSLCAERELIEEVRFKAGVLEPLGIVYPAPGFCDEKQHLFFAKGLVPCSTGSLDEDEMIEVLEWEVSMLEEKIRLGEVADSKTITAFFMARSRGLL